MKRTAKLLSLLMTACMLFGMTAFSVLATEDASYDLYKCEASEGHIHRRDCLTEEAEAEVKNVENMLNVPTLQEIQNARGTTYAKKNFDSDQNKAAAAYDAYVAESFAAREAAQNAYDALSDQLKPFVSAELYSRLAPLDTVLRPITYNVTKGSNGYNFQSVYSPAYELGSHMVSADGGQSNSIPQTLILVEANEDYTWTPDGVYSFGASNYEVLYCCDYDTGYLGGIHYKRMNLEDCDYYDADAAAHIRAIVTNSYPYVSMEQMRENLAKDGFKGADKLTRAEAIAAVQEAIWAYANGATELEYSHTFDVANNSQWGWSLHDYSNEMFNWWEVGKRKFYVDNDAGQRINSLAAYLKKQSSVYIDKNEIIITDVEIVNSAPVQEKDGFFTIAMEVELNNSGSSKLDEIYLSVFVDGVEVRREKVELGKDTYNITVEAENGKEIKTEVYGKQILPTGVYFYQPQGGREVSQSLVGVAKGETEVYSESSILVDVEEPEVFGDLVLQKTDEQDNPLTGAEFALYVESGEDMIYVEAYTADEKGRISLESLLPGNYQLEEITAVDGYYKLEEVIKFAVSDEDGSVSLMSSVEGVSVEAYGELSLMTVKNKRIPTIYDTTTVAGSKTWNDKGYENERPESTTIRVLADGVEVASKVVREADGWEWSFELPKYRDDMTEIVYTVEEDYIEGYLVEYDGFNVINTYVPVDEHPGDDKPIGETPEPGDDPQNGDSTDKAPEGSCPQTGDMPAVIWLILAALSGAALMLFQRKKNIM